MSIWRLLTAIIIFPGLVSASPAQVNRDGASRLAVDVVLASHGRELRGSLLSQTRDDITMAVQRTWLEKHEPEYLQQLETDRQQDALQARQQTIERIADWLESVPPQSRLQSFLETERDRLQNPDKDEQPARFVLLSIPKSDVRRVFTQRPELRRLAAVAWELELDRVEETSFLKLEEQVRQEDPEWKTRRVNLSDQLPAGVTETEREWALRQAILEHRLLDGASEFQGTGDLIFSTGKGAAVNVESLLGPLLNQQASLPGLNVGVAVGWRSRATGAAKDAGRRSVRVTRVTPDPSRGLVVVESVFLALTDQEDWVDLWSVKKSGNISQVRPGALEQVEHDPQVRQLAEAARQLGLGDALDQALKTGAVTLDLNQQVNDEWFLFSDRFLKEINRPRIPDLTNPAAP